MLMVFAAAVDKYESYLVELFRPAGSKLEKKKQESIDTSIEYVFLKLFGGPSLLRYDQVRQINTRYLVLRSIYHNKTEKTSTPMIRLVPGTNLT